MIHLYIKFIVFFLIFETSKVVSYDKIVGDTVHKKMVFHETVKMYALPLMKRIKSVTYKDDANRLIKGIAVLDKDFSLASANITDGGVGYDHATIRMKSERSHTLNYDIEIYI